MLTACPGAFFTDAEYWQTRDDAFWNEFSSRSATADDEAIFLAVISDQPVAMAHTKITDAVAEFGMQYVAPGARGHGIGAALVAERESWVSAHGATAATCAIVVGNTGSERLHRAMGWTETDEVILERAATDDAPAITERRWRKALTR